MKHLWFISWVCYVDDANSSCTGLCVQNDTWLITNNNYVMTIWINHGLRIIQTKWVHFNFVFNFVPLTLKDLERWQWENICFLLLEQILKSIESHFICHGYDFMVILNMFIELLLQIIHLNSMFKHLPQYMLSIFYFNNTNPIR